MLRIILLIAISASLSGCYSLKQVYWQGRLISSAVSVESVVADAATPPSLKSKLEVVKQVLKSAREAGLETGGSYTTYIANKGPYVTHLVKAAEPLKMQWITWWFPVIGSVPYLGFFDVTERDIQAAELAAEGYDVHETGAVAFSGLGWFDDPIYESMLRRKDEYVVHTIFHELVHRNFWLESETALNEPLAELVAQKLTEEWLRNAVGETASRNYLEKQKDMIKYGAWAGSVRKKLIECFGKYQRGEIDQRMALEGKSKIIQNALEDSFPQLSVINSKSIQKGRWNNARLMAIGLYDPSQSKVGKALHCVGSMSAQELIGKLRLIWGRDQANLKSLRHICGTQLASSQP